MEIIDIHACAFSHSLDYLALIPCSKLEPKGINQPPFLFVNVWEQINQNRVSIGPFDHRTQAIVDLGDLAGLFVGPIIILNKVGRC